MKRVGLILFAYFVAACSLIQNAAYESVPPSSVKSDEACCEVQAQQSEQVTEDCVLPVQSIRLASSCEQCGGYVVTAKVQRRCER